MSNKTVAVILIVAISLVGFIFFFEQDTMTTSERMERKGRVFAKFKKDAISRLELKGVSDQSVVVEKVSDPKDPEEKWRIKSPKTFDADEGEIREILSALDFLLIDRAVKGADNIDDERFALKTPRIEGSYVQRGETVSFKIGADADQGEKVYLWVSEVPDTVYAVSSDIVDSLDKDLDALRSKKLVPRTFTDITAVALDRPGGKVSMKKVDEKWQVETDSVWIAGAADQARELVRLVEDLKAERFIADDVKEEDLSKWGLASPAFTLRLESGKGEPVSVFAGKACDGKEGQRYVTVAKSGTVACVNDDFTIIGERPLSRFQETRPVTDSADDIEKIEIARRGEVLAMAQKEGKWETVDKSISIDAAAIEEMLKALTDTRATAIEVGAAATSGLKGDKTEVTLALADEMGTRTLFIYPGNAETVKLRRGDENAVLTVPMSVGEKVVPSLLAFRSRTLLDGNGEDVEKLVVKGPTSQTVEKTDGVWRITAPIDIGADSGAVRKLADLMAGLRVEQFVAEKATAEHGLQSPFAVIEAVLVKAHDHEHHSDTETKGDDETSPPSKKVVLEIGGETPEGKRYARLKGDPVVFIVGDDFEYAIRNPLIARDVLQIDETAAEKVSISDQTISRSFSRENGVWSSDDKAPFNEAALKQIVADLGGLKAATAAYFGAPGPEFKTPLITIAVQGNADGKSDTLYIGEQRDKEKDVGYPARKDGVDATMVVPGSIIDDIVAFLSNKETTGDSAPK